MRNRRWLVWEAEYPDEGSTEIEADSLEQAMDLYREANGELEINPEERTELGGCALTAALRKARRVARGLR
jgi:hypothetical protein